MQAPTENAENENAKEALGPRKASPQSVRSVSLRLGDEFHGRSRQRVPTQPVPTRPPRFETQHKEVLERGALMSDAAELHVIIVIASVLAPGLVFDK